MSPGHNLRESGSIGIIFFVADRQLCQLGQRIIGDIANKARAEHFPGPLRWFFLFQPGRSMALRQQTLRLEALLNIMSQSFKQGIAFFVYFQKNGSVCAFILFLNGEATWPGRRSEPKIWENGQK